MLRHILPLLLLLASCSAAEDHAPIRGIELNTIDLEYGTGAVILPLQKGDQVRWLGYTKAVSYWNPTLSDIQALEQTLQQGLEHGAKNPVSIDEYAVDRPEYQDYVRDRVAEVLARLPEYRRQYIGFVDAEGRKRILLRGFPGPDSAETFEFPHWREEIVVVSDGGCSYWYVVYDVESGELCEFHCNGEA